MFKQSSKGQGKSYLIGLFFLQGMWNIPYEFTIVGPFFSTLSNIYFVNLNK